MPKQVAVFETCAQKGHDDALLVTCLKSIAGLLDDWIDVIDAMDLEQLAHSVTVTLTRFLLDLHCMPPTSEPALENGSAPQPVVAARAKAGKKRRTSLATVVENSESASTPVDNQATPTESHSAVAIQLQTQLINADNARASLTSAVAHLQQQNAELQAAVASRPYLEAVVAALKSELAVAYLEDSKKQKRIDALLVAQSKHSSIGGSSAHAPLQSETAKLERQLTSQHSHAQGLALKVTDAEGRAAGLSTRVVALEHELAVARKCTGDAEAAGEPLWIRTMSHVPQLPRLIAQVQS